MNIRTKDGILIHCLPDYAKCKSSGKSPLEMDECPNYYFGDFGMTCIPELCDKYTEVIE